MSDSLRPHGLYSPWNSPGQNTGVGSFSLLQGSSQPRDWTQVPALQADSLPAEPQGKPKNTGGVACLFSSGPTDKDICFVYLEGEGLAYGRA